MAKIKEDSRIKKLEEELDDINYSLSLGYATFDVIQRRNFILSSLYAVRNNNNKKKRR